MGKPYSQDLRERVLGPIDNGENAYEIVPLFNLSVSYIVAPQVRQRLALNDTVPCLSSPPIAITCELRGRWRRCQTRRLTNCARGLRAQDRGQQQL
jgi:hypothetical protein